VGPPAILPTHVAGTPKQEGITCAKANDQGFSFSIVNYFCIDEIPSVELIFFRTLIAACQLILCLR
jgi:hypothetical protein